MNNFISYLLPLIDNLEKIIYKYKNYKGSNELISFKDSTDERKKALLCYNLCSIDIAQIIDKCEITVSELSRDVCKSDIDCDNEKTSALYEIFSKYQNFSAAVFHFIEQNEKIFIESASAAPFRPTDIQNACSELIYKIEHFKKYLLSIK